MITPENIALLNVGDATCEEFICVRRLTDTKTGKPRFTCIVLREKPVFSGSQGAYSVDGAMKLVMWYRNRL